MPSSFMRQCLHWIGISGNPASHICCVFRVQPDDIGAYVYVGRTLDRLQLYSESEQVYRTALALLLPIKSGACVTVNINMPLNIHYRCNEPAMTFCTDIGLTLCNLIFVAVSVLSVLTLLVGDTKDI